MAKQQIESGEAPNISLTCDGDLHIRGWEEPAVRLSGEDYQIEQGEKTLSITSPSDMDLTVPTAAVVTVRAARGDMIIRTVTGLVQIDEVNGDAVIQSCGPVEVGSVHGDLMVRNLSGSFAINEVMGDASLRNLLGASLSRIHGDCVVQNANGPATVGDCMGDLSLKTVGGDLSVSRVHRDVNLRNLGGLSVVEHAHGDIRLRGGLAGGKHRFSADGDIVIRWPVGTPVNIEAQGSSFRNRMSLDEVSEKEGAFSGRVGQGKTFLLLEARGRIILKDLDQADSWDDLGAVDIDFSDLGAHIATEINSRMGELSSKLEQKLGPRFAARMEKRAQEAAAKAEKAAERAMRKAEKAARRAQWQARRSGYTPPAPPRPKKKTRQATQEEQLKILKMVEQGIISPEEANTLMEAIEG